ncbi:MAG: low molecular weight phosphotyrosine protein phosphatase [Actinomycetaceae bacterium]|nr:low molecular weight phosphotyrosine protein phosphatase [Actinomycetaceae bacterium]
MHNSEYDFLYESLRKNPKILVVCTGNICRSPMGEIVVRSYLEKADLGGYVSVESCGVSAEEKGNPIYGDAAQVLREAGYDVGKHYAMQVSDNQLRESGLILAMTTGHAYSLRQRMLLMGEDIRRIHLWKECDGTLSFAPYGCFGEGGFLSGELNGGNSKASVFAQMYISDGSGDVPDPWMRGRRAFEETLECIEAGAYSVVKMVRSCFS